MGAWGPSAKTLMQTITEIDIRSGAILCPHEYNSGLQGKLLSSTWTKHTHAHNGPCRIHWPQRHAANPMQWYASRLSGKTGPALDPCAAIQVVIDLAEDQEREIIFRLGAGVSLEDALNINKRFEGSTAAQLSFSKVTDYWNKMLGAVQVQTPDKALNLIANGWLNYQTLACRVWARSGFYQSGGAYGFRDQLQDVMSLVHNDPSFLKAQLLLCASRQFKEGDVQHWWHPPTGRG